MRSCNGCTLCCELLGITEINKPANSKCWNQTRDGCSVYEHRPPSCAQFECAWRLSHVPKNLRPSKTGAVIASNNRMIKCFVRENQVPHKQVMEQLADYAKAGITVVIASGSDRFVLTRSGGMQQIFQGQEAVAPAHHSPCSSRHAASDQDP